MPVKNGFAERRKYFRLDARYVLKCEEFTAKDLFRENGMKNAVEAVSKNISLGGVLVEVKKPFKLGDILRMEIDIPGWEKFKAEFYKDDVTIAKKPLVVLGKVVRTENLGKNFELGICFVAIDEGHKWALLKYLKKRQ